MKREKTIFNYEEAVSYRKPMTVTAVRGIRYSFGLTTFPICPRCGISMDREYTAYCDRCGQALGWKDLDHARVIL